MDANLIIKNLTPSQRTAILGANKYNALPVSTLTATVRALTKKNVVFLNRSYNRELTALGLEIRDLLVAESARLSN